MDDTTAVLPPAVDDGASKSVEELGSEQEPLESAEQRDARQKLAQKGIEAARDARQPTCTDLRKNYLGAAFRLSISDGRVIVGNLQVLFALLISFHKLNHGQCFDKQGNMIVTDGQEFYPGKFGS